MRIVYFVILGIVILLRVCAILRKPDLPVTDNSYSKVFLAPAALICNTASGIVRKKSVGCRNKHSIKDQKLAQNLQLLYPGDSADSRIYRYRVELVSTILLVVTVGVTVCIIMSYLAETEGVLTDGRTIYRNTYEGDPVETRLSAGVITGENKSEEFDIGLSVPARIYSREEADALFEQMSESADDLLLNGNDNPDHIMRPLKLITSVSGYPFTISWESSDYELIDYDGIVHNEDLTEPKMVQLTGDCSYMGNHWYLIRDLQVVPKELTASEMIYEEIMASIQKADEKSSTSDHITLPASVFGKSLSWTEKLNDLSPMILFGVLLLCVFIVPFRESEINSQIKKRSRDLLIEYPAFVSQLTLLLGAGMSVRNCLVGMGKKAGKKSSKGNTCLEKELIITAHELEVGISEPEAIEHFGKRCKTREYMRFSALLIQNMKKGSSDLIGMLKAESEDAFTLRKNEARKLGEEASTKLLLPMVMMLTVVMIIIMVPAYMSFSS